MFDKLRGIMFEDDPKNPRPAKPVTPPTQFVGAPQVVQQPGQVATAQVAVQNEFVTLLREVVKNRHSAYNALMAAADKMATIIPDLTTRLKAANATIAGEGRDTRSIVDSIRIHINDLQSQKTSFARQSQEAMQKAVGAKKAELDGIDPAISALQQQIVSLQQQAAQLENTIRGKYERKNLLAAEIAQEEAHFHAATQRFDSALSFVTNDLETQGQIIQSALP